MILMPLKCTIIEKIPLVDGVYGDPTASGRRLACLSMVPAWP